MASARRVRGTRWCYNAAEWKQCVTKDWMWCRCKGEQCALDKVDPSARVVRGVLQGGVGDEECEPPLADGIWTYVPDDRRLVDVPASPRHRAAGHAVQLRRQVPRHAQLPRLRLRDRLHQVQALLRQVPALDRRERQGRQRRWQLGPLRPRGAAAAAGLAAASAAAAADAAEDVLGVGDPHYIGFDGGEYDFHGLGVHTMAEWQGSTAAPATCRPTTAR